MADQLDILSTWADGKLKVEIKNGTIQFKDKLDPASAVSRDRFLKRVQERFPAVDIKELDRQVMQETPPPNQRTDVADDDPSKPHDAALAQMPADVRDEARQILLDPKLLERVLRDMQSAGIVGEHDLALTIYLIGTSRLLPNPLAAIVQGSSSSGKSHVIDTIGALFPPESTLLATDLTANSLYYLPKGSLRHRFVVAGERSRKEDDERAECTRALREMLSSHVLRKVLPQKNGDHIETIVIENPGPIAFVESTTLAEIFEEDRTRAMLLASDDGDEQTRAVVTAIADRYAGATPDDSDRLRQRHWAMQRMLRRVAVQVPFAPELAKRMPTDRPEARRAIHQVLSIVQAIALLQQFQRHDDPQHGSVVLATLEDYRVARRLLAGPLARALGAALPDHVVSFAQWLQKATKDGEGFTVPQLVGRAGCRWSRTSLYDLVKPLHAVGFLADAGMDGRSAKHRIAGPLPDAAATWLPTAEDLA